MKAWLIVALALIVSGCLETRGQQWRDQASLELKVAQEQWNECAADKTCTGDEMYKRRARLQDAMTNYDHADARVRYEYSFINPQVHQ